MGGVAERFNGDNRLVLPHKVVIALQQYTRVRQVQMCKHLLGYSLLHITELLAIDVDSRRLAGHEDSEAPIATAGIGDEPGTYLVHVSVGLAKLDEWVLIQVFVHRQSVQMIAHIVHITGLRMDTVHRIIIVADELLVRHTTSCYGFIPLSC